MATEFRKTGINVVGDVPWGTHFCSFYESKQDLLDTLIPYFKAGLGRRELCVWVIADPLTREEARNALRRAVPDLDRYESEQSIEMLTGEEWYLQGDTLDLNRVTNAWNEKLDQALARGYQGLRVSGDTCWLQKRDWQDFCTYENQINESISNQAMALLCTYPLAQCGAAEILDVARTHQFAIARRQGDWEVIETLQLKQARAEIKKLNEELEQRVVERTRELAAINEKLRDEIAERKQAEENLRKQKEILQKIFDHNPAMISFFDERGRIKLVNRTWERMRGWSLEEILEQNLDILIESYPDLGERDRARKFIRAATGEWVDFKTRVRDGRVIDTTWAATRLSDGTTITIGQDISERKRAEERLQEYEKVVEGLEEIIVVIDRDYRYLIANRAFLSYRGLEREELIGHSITEFLDAEIFEKVIKKKLDEVLQGKVVKYELKYAYPKLGERDLSVSYFPIEGPAGIDRVACVFQDITERKRSEAQLRATSEQLRALTAKLESAREEEGARIAREIHDELGSALTALKWDLETIDREYVEAEENSDLVRIREKIAAMMQLIDATTQTMKRISAELRPSILDDIGLVDAIEWQTQQFQTRTGIMCNCDFGPENVSITREQATAIFRIFQEALTNILRHAKATQVDVTVKQDSSELMLTIKDNGRGMTEEEKSRPESLGLLGMRERVSLIGGQIDITGVEGEGTVVTVRVPLLN